MATAKRAENGEIEYLKKPLKAIRAKCLDCSGDSSNEVKLCPIPECWLFPFRFGKNPYSTRTLSEEQKSAMSDRMKKLRKTQLEQKEAS